MVDIGLIIFIICIVLGFGFGLLFNRSRSIIRFILFVGLYALIYYVVAKNFNGLASINDESGNPIDLTTYTKTISDLVTQLNDAFVQIGEATGISTLKSLPAALSDNEFYVALIATAAKIISHYIAIILAFVLSYILSFLINIPFYISYNKRNKVVRVDESGNEVPVKIKKKFSYRIVPAILGAVLLGGISILALSPVYSLRNAMENVSTSIKEIDTSCLDTTITNIDNKSAELKETYGETVSSQFDSKVGELKSTITSLEEGIDSSLTTIPSKIDTIIDKIPSSKFTDLVYGFNLPCVEITYKENKSNIDDYFLKLCNELKTIINDDVKEISKYADDTINNFKI